MCHRADAQASTWISAKLRDLADVTYNVNDIGAAIASRPFKTVGMIVVPCSMRTLAAIATGYSALLLTRAADVILKERRRLVLVPRGTPLHLVHLRNVLTVTEMGAIVCLPVPAFYAAPHSLSDMVEHLVGRILDLFNIETGLVRRWDGRRATSVNVGSEIHSGTKV